MVAIVSPKSPQPEGAEPAWDIARLFPAQGCWSELDYLCLDTNRLVEFTDGFIEVLAMPTPAHQRIVRYLSEELRAFTRPQKLGEVLFAPMRVRLRPKKFREPDVMFMLAAHKDQKDTDYWNGADILMEVVSEDAQSQTRDHQTKRADYAEAGIPEYWVIDPWEKKVVVLMLEGNGYSTHGEFSSGQSATSHILSGFSIATDAIWAAALDE